MITLLILLFLAIIAAFGWLVISGLIALSPIFLLLILLPLVDYLIFKLIFRRKKK